MRNELGGYVNHSISLKVLPIRCGKNERVAIITVVLITVSVGWQGKNSPFADYGYLRRAISFPELDSEMVSGRRARSPVDPENQPRNRK